MTLRVDDNQCLVETCFISGAVELPNPRLKTDVENARLGARFIRHGLAA
jgi:hypothetical protein